MNPGPRYIIKLVLDVIYYTDIIEDLNFILLLDF